MSALEDLFAQATGSHDEPALTPGSVLGLLTQLAAGQGGGVAAGGGSSLPGNLQGIVDRVLGPNSPLLAQGPHGVELQRQALQSLFQGKRALGIPLFAQIGSSYRTPAEQARLYQQKPGLAAPPGQSLHQEGLAIDVKTNSSFFDELARWLLGHGWNRWNASKEPWHFSYGRTG